VFAASPQGSGESGPSDVSTDRDFLLHIANRRAASDLGARVADASRLLEAAASPANLAMALLNVVRNKVAPGVDGRSVMEAVGSALSLLPRLQRALLDGTYRPGDIRRVWISKPGGGQRGLGISNVIYRWVQQAVLQVLEPIFEPTFHSSSHGFRPKRGAHTAIAEAKEYVGDGYGAVVDIDLSKFFDRVHHQRLLVNEKKSKVARPDEIHFLGLRLRKTKDWTKVDVLVSTRTKERMDANIRELTPRVWGRSPSRCIEQLNVNLRGWSSYFRICTEENVYRLHVWDAHIRRWLRAILVRQKKRPRHLYRARTPRPYGAQGGWRRSVADHPLRAKRRQARLIALASARDRRSSCR
jgi:hypothetical protein